MVVVVPTEMEVSRHGLESYWCFALVGLGLVSCGVVGGTLAFGFIGHGFESKHSLFSHHRASAFCKLTSLAKCSLYDSVR